MQDGSYARSMSSRGQQGTLRQLPDGRWQARYREQGRSGKRPQRTFPENQKRAAAAWLRDGLAEAEHIQTGDLSLLVRRREQGRTVSQACDDFLAAHDASAARIDTLHRRLNVLRKDFGDRPVQSLEPFELQAWRKTIKPGWRSEVFKAAKQMLKQAVVWNWIATNPCDGIKNPRGRRPEVTPLPWETTFALEDEITLAYQGLPTFMAATGLRPEEWIALERSDVDLVARLVNVRRVWTQIGGLVELGHDGTKTGLQRRTVPLRQLAVDALAARTPRIDSPLLWPAAKGGYISLSHFRDRVWRPSFVAADVPYLHPYTARHAYAADSIAATIDLFTLSRRMGTSLKEIDDTYGHLVGDSAERELALLDAWDARRAANG